MQVYDTNPTLPYQTSETFADGTWYIGMSYFDGVLDSGFYPQGQSGLPYQVIVVSGGVIVGTPPSPVVDASLSGNVLVRALYYPGVDPPGSQATSFYLTGTYNSGLLPINFTPATIPIGGNPAILSYTFPAQMPGTVVDVTIYTQYGSGPTRSAGVTLSLTIPAVPSSPLGLQSWPGNSPED
jgi:hypothetical protein